MKNAQAALEFSAMIGFAAIFFAVMLIIAFAIFSQSKSERSSNVLNKYADVLQKEIILASDMHDGYYSFITIPDNIEGMALNISNTDRYILIAKGDYRIDRQIPYVEGMLKQGRNRIEKINGKVKIS